MLTQNPAPARNRQGRHRSSLFSRSLAPTLVLTAAVLLAGMLLRRFLTAPRLLWNDPIHDRNAHLYSGLCLATDATHGRWGQLLGDLDSFRTWPPLHDGVLVGLALLIGREQEQWAVMPSLIGWVGTATFAFLLARRAFSPGGTLAGMVAALFVLVSPAQRAFATDVMLESLGACLTLACLYFSVRTEQEPSAQNSRGLALALTLLFFEKYNYWLLVALALAADAGWRERHTVRRFLREHLAAAALGRRLLREVRQPLTWTLGVLICFSAAVIATGGTDVILHGRHVSIHSAANLMTLAYVVFLLRLRSWYRTQGRDWIRRSGPRTQTLVTYHVWPVALWLLWPQRLFSVLWVVDPAANAGTHPRHDLWGGYSYYWACLTHDYHIAAWSALAALGLMAVAFVAGARGRLRPGASAILWLILISALLTVHHPYRSSRFLHSWVPAVWVAAGVGAASLADRRRCEKGRPLLQPLLACFMSLLTVPQIPALLAPAHAPEGGIQASTPSTLNITDAYLPDLAGSQHAAVFSSVPMKFLAQWTYLQRYGRAARLETDIPGYDPAAPDNSAALSQWLAKTRCDTIVALDFPAGTVFNASAPDSAGWSYGTLLAWQPLFVPVRRRVLPDSGCTIIIWRRK